MDITKLEKANELNRQIEEFNEALKIFRWDEKFMGNLSITIVYTNQTKEKEIPINLTELMKTGLKLSISEALNNAVDEFNAL